MKSIQRRFEAIQEKNPNYSSYLSFAHAISGQKFSRPTIARWYKKLVEVDDYAPSERKEIIDYLVLISKRPVDEGFKGENRQGEVTE